jgi:superfamily II RNA helicase
MGYLTQKGLTDKGEFAASLFGYELLLSEMKERGVLETLTPAKLSVLLSALVFEPRRGDRPPPLDRENERLLKTAEHPTRLIHRLESKFRIFPYTKLPHFHLAEAIEAWVRGETFERILRRTPADEGELVRYFRMVVQLLRELVTAHHASEKLKATAEEARRLINRDIIDAERQLRI